MDIIYEIKKDNINYSIINKKYNIKKKFRINNFTKYLSEILIKQRNDKKIMEFFKLTRFLSITRRHLVSPFYKYILYDIFNISNVKIYDSENNNFVIVKNSFVNYDNNKNNVLYFFSFSPDLSIQNSIYRCEYQYYLYRIRMKWLKYILKKLKNGDNIGTMLHSVCDHFFINLAYILSLIFDKVIILKGTVLLCINFNKNSEYIKYITNFDENKNSYLEINPKPNLDNMLVYLNNMFDQFAQLYKLVLTKNEDKIYNEIYKFYCNMAKDTFIKTHDKNNLYHKYLQQYFMQYFNRLFYTDDNNKNIKHLKFHSTIEKKEADSIQHIIKTNKFKKCLEIGMAFGISAFYILTADKNIDLISIDPYQRDINHWNSIGIKLLKKMELEKQHNLISDLSYIALPNMLKKYKKNYFDFIFIDGWHRFDYSIIDFFYADKLLRIDGIILIDDVQHEGIKDFVKFIEKYYPNYKRIKTEKTQAGFVKIEEHPNEMFFHAGF